MMRGIAGLIGLLAALVVAGVLVKQQLQATRTPVPALHIPATPGDPAPNSADIVPAPGTPTQPNQPVQQQFKQALDNALQAREMPDDKP